MRRRRLGTAALLLLLILPPGARAADVPQDRYLALYSSFHEALGFENGVRASSQPDKRVSLATVRKQYQDTLAKTAAFQKDHPGWESVIVRNLTERIRERIATLDAEEEASALQYAPIAVLLRQAEQQEKAGAAAAAAALKQYQDAATRLDAFRKAHPNWNPDLVDYRIKEVREKLGQLAPDDDGSLQDLESTATDYAAAYALFAEAAQFEKDGIYSAARKRYTEIGVAFDAFRKAHPNWNPDLIDSRIRQARDKLAAIANKKDPAPAAPAPPATAAAPAPASTPAKPPASTAAAKAPAPASAAPAKSASPPAAR